MYVTDQQILTDLAGILKAADVTALLTKGPWWSSVVALRHATVYQDIIQALVARGYTQAQIDAWDAGPTYERVLTVYWCLVDNGVLSEAGAAFLEKAERYLKALDLVTLTTAGATTVPAGLSGQVSTGTLTAFNDPTCYWREPVRRQREGCCDG